jgi:hypothetical protein
MMLIHKFRRMLLYVSLQQRLPRLRRRLRVDYDVNTLTPDQALLIAGNLAYDQAGARDLLKTSGKTATQLLEENPHQEYRPNMRKRFYSWLMRLEGSMTFEVADSFVHSPEYREK